MNPTLCCKATLYYEAKRKDYADSKLPIKTSIKSTDDDLNDLNSLQKQLDHIDKILNYKTSHTDISTILSYKSNICNSYDSLQKKIIKDIHNTNKVISDFGREFLLLLTFDPTSLFYSLYNDIINYIWNFTKSHFIKFPNLINISYDSTNKSTRSYIFKHRCHIQYTRFHLSLDYDNNDRIYKCNKCKSTFDHTHRFSIYKSFIGSNIIVHKKISNRYNPVPPIINSLTCEKCTQDYLSSAIEISGTDPFVNTFCNLNENEI